MCTLRDGCAVEEGSRLDTWSGNAHVDAGIDSSISATTSNKPSVYQHLLRCHDVCCGKGLTHAEIWIDCQGSTCNDQGSERANAASQHHRCSVVDRATVRFMTSMSH